MKNYRNLMLLGVIVLGLTACNSISDVSSSLTTSDSTTTSGSTTTSTTTSITLPDLPNTPTDQNFYGLLDNVQDGVILHAWNWSMQNIKEALPQIAAAGYTTVQTSPMQPQKDYNGQATWSSDWWKLYQPLGFSVATENNAIGTKDDLIELCQEADKYGIKIIVDVVANHLAGGSSESLNSNVASYEPDIYENNLIHTGYGGVSDSNVASLVRGYLGDYPDLQTENATVQERVLSLLKEYVDCGVDGFRFDAAKHIETKYDGDYASNFWDYVLGGASEYAVSTTGKDLYYYGEILNTVGSGRNISWYTELMSVTDSSVSSTILSYVRSGIDPSNITLSDPTSKVLWAESHDNYANDSQETTNISQNVIDRAYAVTTNFTGATSLYFVRPTSGSVMGQIATTDWQSNQISHVNKFHNQFYDVESDLGYDNGYFISIKDSDDDYGIMLVSLGTSVNTSVSASYSNLKDGTYTDQVSGNTFTVSNGTITGEMDSSGIAVLYTPEVVSLPIINVSNDGSSIFYDPIDVTITVDNATEAYYIIDDGEEVYFDGTTTVTIGEGVSSGNIYLTIIASNESYSVGARYTYQKRDRDNLIVYVENIPDQYVNDRTILAWVWTSGSEGRWVEGTLSGNSFNFSVTDEDTHFLLASFDSSITIDTASWSIYISQTEDIVIDVATTYDASTFSWRNRT